MSLITLATPASGVREPAPASLITVANYQRYALYLVLAIGIGFRLFHYFYNRSLFIDELYLNINLVKLNFWELATQPLAYEQKAPIGYLWTVKACVLLFGKGEKALRLFSLVCGISALFAFIPVARFYLKAWGVVLAVGILSLSWATIYHSVEAKQYSAELLATVLGLLLYTKYHNATRLQPLLLWGLAGGLLLWFSFSLIFVLAGIGSTVSFKVIFERNWKRFFTYLIPFSIWLLSFSVLYLLFIGKYHQSGWLIDFFDKAYDAFMPLGLTSFDQVLWFIKKPYNVLYHPLGLLLHLDENIANSSVRFILKLGWLEGVFILFGMNMLFRSNRLGFFILFLPILITFLSSGLKLYPIFDRFILFLAPPIILFLAFGLEKVAELFSLKYKATALLMLLLAAPALANSAHHILYPHVFLKLSNSTEREGILYINENFREGDVVYVFWNMRHAYDYYKEAYGLKYTAVRGSYVKGISTGSEDYLRKLSPDFENFKEKKRLWYIYNIDNSSDIGEYVGQPAWYSKEGYVAPFAVEQALNKVGNKISRHEIYYQRIILYDLKK